MNANELYTQLPWRHNPSLPVLLGVSDLARLLGVAPSVLTNWRSRSTRFPADRSAGTQPQFDVVEVLEWLRHSGPRSRPVPRLDPLVWWGTLARAFHAQTAIRQARRTLAALVLLRHTSARWPALVEVALTRGDDTRAMRAAVDDALLDPSLGALFTRPDGAPDSGSMRPLLAGPLDVPSGEEPFLADLVDALDQVDGDRLAEALAMALDVERDVRGRPLQTTSSPLALVMGSLARPAQSDVVFDPACGEGSLLLACAETAEGSVRLVGQEIDETAVVIARTRLLVAGHSDHRLAEPGHDSLRDDQFPDLRADVVVIDPPFADDAPPLELWIEHGLRHVADRGRVVVTVPLSSLVDVKAARRRAAPRVTSLVEGLAADRRVEGVVVLPRGHRVDVVGPLAIVVLGPGSRSLDAGVPVGLVALPSPATRGSDDAAHLIAEITPHLRTDGVRGLAAIDDDRVEVDVVRSTAALFDHLSGIASRIESGGRRRRNSPRLAATVGAGEPTALRSVLFDEIAAEGAGVNAAFLPTLRSDVALESTLLAARSVARQRAVDTRLDDLMRLVDELQGSMTPEAHVRLRAAVEELRSGSEAAGAEE